MLKSILALIVSCAMLGSAGSVPAAPLSETRTVIENIVVTGGGESVALDHAIEFTAAAGSEEAAVGFELDKGGESVLPLKAKITPEALLFRVAETGSVYSLTDDFIAEYTGLEGDDIAILAYGADFTGSLVQEISIGNHMGFAAELYNAISAHEAAEAVESDEPFTEGVTLHLGSSADYAFADMMRESDTEYLSRFMQGNLDLAGLLDGAEYASYAEMSDGSAGSDTYTMFKTSSGGIDFSYMLTVASTDGDGETLMDMIFQPEYFCALEQSQDLPDEDSTLHFECSMDNGRIVDAMFSYGYREEDVDTFDYDSEYTDAYIEDTDVRYYYSLSEGRASHDFSISVFMESENMKDGEVTYSDTTRTTVTVAAAERAGESGGSVTGVEAGISVDASYTGADPTKFDLGVAFDVRTEETAYQDSFAGAKVIAIESEDDIPPQLMGDGMMLASQLALLEYDEKISALPGLLEKAIMEGAKQEEEDIPGPVLDDGKMQKKDKPVKPDIVLPDKTEEPDPAIDEGKLQKKDKPAKPDIVLPDKTEEPDPAIDEDKLKEKYDLDEPIIDVNADKTEAETNNFPDFTPPEGYVLKQVDESEYDLYRTYYDADGNMIDFYAGDVTHGKTYNHQQIELPEGAAGMPVKLYYNDDGTLYGASFIKEGYYFDIYSDAGVSLEEMEAMINSVAF